MSLVMRYTQVDHCLFVGWLLNVLATCQCISGTDLHRQYYVHKWTISAALLGGRVSRIAGNVLIWSSFIQDLKMSVKECMRRSTQTLHWLSYIYPQTTGI